MNNIRYSKVGFLVFLFSFICGHGLAQDQTPKELDKKIEDVAKERVDLKKKNPLMEMRAIYLFLMDFELDFGSFPDESVMDDLEEFNKVNHLAKGSSNRYLGMLFAGGYANAKLETYFSFPFDSINVKKADQVINEEKLLEVGECSFTYNAGLSTSSNGATPVLLFPVVPGKMSFDPVAGNGKAYVLRVDGAVTSYDVAADGSVMVNGKSFFDPTQPYWDGKMNLCYPVVKKP